jgi:hypothetical protein
MINSIAETLNFTDWIILYLFPVNQFFWILYSLLRKKFKAIVFPADSNDEDSGERHCRRTVSCALGAPVKTIVSTQLTHGCWPVQADAGQPRERDCNKPLAS